MALDALVLSGTSINDETNYVLEAIDFTPPAKKPEWAQAADADGANLIRTPLFENRTITMTLRVAPQSTKNAALEKLGTLVDLLQEAEKNPGGIPLEWTPASSTKTISFYVLTGAVTAIPMVNEGSGAGYYNANAPQVNISLTCKPFGYGAEVEGAAAKSIETGLSAVVLTVPTVAGDVPAEGRLVIKDTAAVGRRFVEWGLEQRYYNAATALILDSEDMTPVGGTQSTLLNASGAYKRAGATKGTIGTRLFPTPTICASTGNLKHVGTFRVKARVYAAFGPAGTLSSTSIRLSYQDGEGPFRANEWTTPPIGNVFAEVDLGVITLTPAQTGTQKWVGRIEAFSNDEPAWQELHIDYLTIIPVLEGYGKARASPRAYGQTLVAYDNFTTGTLSGSLNARAAPLGGSWATSGTAPDFTVSGAGATRSTTSDASGRQATLGAALTDMQVNMSVNYGGPSASKAEASLSHHAILARWVNATNYAAFIIWQEGTGTRMLLQTVVAGVGTTVNGLIIDQFPTYLGLAVTSDGVMRGTAVANGIPVAFISGSSSVLATGGALASGKAGYQDSNPSAVAAVRKLLELNVFSLPAPTYCVQPSRTMEVRSDSSLTTDSGGTIYGPVPQYRGSRFYVPQDGSANRTSRIIVKADRNDLEESDQQTIADAFTAQPFVTPRYHVIPR